MKDTLYHCPVEVAMELLGPKWTTVILAHIKEDRRRFSELRRLVPDVSEKVLSQRLRTLELEGLITRSVISVSPPHVEYDLTDAGRSLAPALQALYDWGETWAEQQGLIIESTGP